jgi:hypothetical protein
MSSLGVGLGKVDGHTLHPARSVIYRCFTKRWILQRLRLRAEHYIHEYRVSIPKQSSNVEYLESIWV